MFNFGERPAMIRAELRPLSRGCSAVRHCRATVGDMRGSSYEGTPPPEMPGPANWGRRVALVIGNGAYRHTTRLPNPANDARALADKLSSLGFEVVGGATEGIDLDYGAMAARIRDFGRRLRDGADTALLFFAGHGIQVHGRNYLVPIDATLELESDVGSELFELQSLLNQMERRDRTSIVMLDACRNNPLVQNLARAMGLADARSAGITEGLAEQRVVAGTLIAYATQPGHVAYDGDGEHGFFTEALLSNIDRPGLDVELMLRDVRGQVLGATQTKRLGPQVPWVHSSILGSFYFRPLAAQGDAPSKSQPAASLDADDRLWARIERSERIADFEFYLEQFPSGRHTPLARFEIRRLEEVAESARQRVEAEARAKAEQEALQREASNWAWAEQEKTVEAYERFLAAWPQGRFSNEARTRIATLNSPPPAAKPSVSVSGNVFTNPTAMVNQAPLLDRSFEVRVGDGKNDRTVQLSPGETAPKDAPFAPEMVLVPPGKFWMGSKDGEGDADERPRHEVTIAYPLMVGKYPVTFEEWDAFDRAGGIVETKETTSGLLFKKTETSRQKYTPGDQGWGRGRRPVINVSWNDAKAYAAWLSQQTGKAYRLLSEAEWEYACRAGTQTAYSFGNTISTKQAQLSEGNVGSAGKTVEVGSFPANPFGLHDMHGNVWEWVEDARHGSYEGAPTDGSARTSADATVSRVVRGGSWYVIPQSLRSPIRSWYLPGTRLNDLGFRLARTLNP
jgi:formylglycine-generating enzyme required for sulfatase activity